MEFISSIHTLLREIEERGHYLEEREAIFQAILDNIPVAIIGTNEYGKISLFNREAELLTGYDAEDAFLKPISLIYWKGSYNKIKEELAINDKLETETLLMDKEGAKVPVHAMLVKISDENVMGFY
ncbi:MAG: hypothetical protein DRI52_10600, partial [Chloroflexi bacterium]